MSISGNTQGLIKWSKAARQFFACGGGTDHPRAGSLNILDWISVRGEGLTAEGGETFEIGKIGTDHTHGLVLEANNEQDLILQARGGGIRLQGGGSEASLTVWNSKIYTNSDLYIEGAVFVGKGSNADQGMTATLVLADGQEMHFKHGILVRS